MRLYNIYESLAGGNLATASPMDQTTQTPDQNPNQHEIDLTDPALQDQPQLGQQQEPPSPSTHDDDVMVQAQAAQRAMPQVPPQLRQLDKAFSSALDSASPAAMGKWITARTRNVQPQMPQV